MTVVFPILTLCFSPWATKGAWGLLVSLGWGSATHQKAPWTCASCLYANISPSSVREEEIWSVSYFCKQKVLPISPWGTSSSLRTFGTMKQQGTTGRYHQHSSLNYFYLHVLYLQHFFSQRRSSRRHMYSVAPTARWHSTVLTWKSDFC